MHIRRDNLFARPYPVAHNFEGVLSVHSDPSTVSPERPLDPFHLAEAARRGFVDKKRAEMIAKAGGAAGEEGKELAGRMTFLRK